MSAATSQASLKLALERLDETMIRLGSDASVRALSDIRQLISQAMLDMEAPREGDRRRDMRMAQTAVTVLRKDGAEFDCVIGDLSIGGALIDTETRLPVGSKVEIDIPRAGTVTAEVIGVSQQGMHVTFLAVNDEQRKAILDGFSALLWK